MLIYVLRWQSSWISDRHKKQKLGKGHSWTKGPGELLPSLDVRSLLSVECKLFTFQASSPKPLGRLEPNLAGMLLGWSSTKFQSDIQYGS
jgi:hypothetical protein